MAIGKSRTDKLNAEECFMLWFKLGALEKVSRHLAMEGKINLKTNKAFSVTAIQRQAYKWIIENSQEARGYFEKAGLKFSDDNWNIFLIKRALWVYNTSRRRFMDWVDRMNFRRYENAYKHKVADD